MKNRHLLRFRHLQNDRGLIFPHKATEYSDISGTEPRTVYFCSHFGTSMNPTLSAQDLLGIARYGHRKVRVGDVIIFQTPEGDRLAVHRVVSVTSGGIHTKGDNNNRIDTWCIRPEDVFGQVVWAARGKRQRPIYGGNAGRLWCFGIRGFHVMERCLSVFYHLVVRSGLLRRLVPLRKRMKVISLRNKGGRAFTLLFGHWVIGHYQTGMTSWQIRRPFRIFVDEQSLPT